jgi:membrane-bound lytic murein transglycosylase D
LQSLPKLDEQRARQLFQSLAQKLEATNVYDLAPLKKSALQLLPVLKVNQATHPYAEWLESHLDYLDAADKLWRKKRLPPPKPGAPPPKPPPPPTPKEQREVWDETLQKRPVPSQAHLYVSKLKPIFVREKVPPALVWLAEVESSFNPNARSPVGAAGLFQFMPTTAKSLGLSLAPKDERLDPERSAQAAGHYLRYLYGRFGDWRLALAAYNAGETRVNNLLTRHQTKSFDVIAPSLPAETQLYVPKIEATLRKREGAALTELKLAAARIADWELQIAHCKFYLESPRCVEQ